MIGGKAESTGASATYAVACGGSLPLTDGLCFLSDMRVMVLEAESK